MNASSTRQRPVLAVVATPGTTERVRALVRQLALSVDVRSLDRLDGRMPDAVLVTSIAALASAPPGVPLAVWVDRVDEIPTSCTVVLSDRPELVHVDVDSPVIVLTPPDGLDVTALPVLPPLLRQRWCERYGLPADHVAHIGEGEGGAGDDHLAELAVAAAGVVTGPLLSTALALGTPVVTSTQEAARLGAAAGEHLEVAPVGSADAEALARRIVADDHHSARLSAAARRLAEQRLDVGVAARSVVTALELVAAPAHVLPSPFDERLAELRVLPGSRVHRRAEAAVADLVSPRS